MFDENRWLFILGILGILVVVVLVICIGSIDVTVTNPDKCFSYREFDGHQYVMFHNGYHGGIAHSPKCPCLNGDSAKAEEGN